MSNNISINKSNPIKVSSLRIIELFESNFQKFLDFSKKLDAEGKINKVTSHIKWTTERLIQADSILYEGIFSEVLSIPNCKYKTSHIDIKIDESEDIITYKVYYIFKDFLYKRCLKTYKKSLKSTPISENINKTKSKTYKLKTSTDEFIKKVIKVHGENTYDYSNIIYSGQGNPIKVICPAHGEFNPLAGNFLSGHGCPKCSKEQAALKSKKTKEQLLNEIGDKYEGRADLSQIEYKGARTNVKVILPNGEIWWAPPSSLIRGVLTPLEMRELRLNPHNLKTQETFLKEAYEVHGNTYDYSKSIYVSANKPIEIICKTHGSFFMSPDAHVRRGLNCPLCKISVGESKVLSFLEKNNIKYIREYRFDNCRYKKRLPFDFYLPDYNICIEYQGEQHFHPSEFHFKLARPSNTEKSQKEFEKLKVRDKIKEEYCKNNNIPLVLIPYNTDVKSFLESNLLPIILDKKGKS